MRLPIILTLLVACALPAFAQQWAGFTDDELKAELRQVERELGRFDDLQGRLERSARKSNNTERAKAVDAMQQHMIDCVVRREEIVGQEHTIIRHGQQVGGLTDAADVGSPNANKESRRRMRKGTSTKSDAFLRLAWMQQQVMGGERIAQPAIERQPGAFENYTDLVNSFGGALREEQDGLIAEMAKRDKAAAAAAAGDTVLNR
ncbi:MAG TPA: hypothetical protein PLQ13_03100 [Candidatus Krumholzibacteria bacterium]|nr:hypothetical protein [Candidatus Krumholzibacteria bacterium]